MRIHSCISIQKNEKTKQKRKMTTANDKMRFCWCLFRDNFEPFKIPSRWSLVIKLRRWTSENENRGKSNSDYTSLFDFFFILSTFSPSLSFSPPIHSCHWTFFIFISFHSFFFCCTRNDTRYITAQWRLPKTFRIYIYYFFFFRCFILLLLIFFLSFLIFSCSFPVSKRWNRFHQQSAIVSFAIVLIRINLLSGIPFVFMNIRIIKMLHETENETKRRKKKKVQ